MSNDPSDGPRGDHVWHPPAGPTPEQYPPVPPPAGPPWPQNPGQQNAWQPAYGQNPPVPNFQAPNSQPPNFQAPNPWGQPSGWGGPYPPPGYAAPPKPGVIPLRPLGLGEILDGAFQACRRNPLATFGTAILFQTIVALVTVGMSAGLFSAVGQLESPGASSQAVSGALASVVSFASVVTVVSGGALLILQGVLVVPVARAVLNQRTGFAQMWRLSARRILPLLLLGVLLTLAFVAGIAVVVLISVGLVMALQETSLWIIVPLILAVIAAVTWLSIKLVLAPAALMLEGTGPLDSVRRSWVLTGRNWWRTFGIVLLTSIMVSIITSVIATPISFLVMALFTFSDAPAANSATALDSLPVFLITQVISAFFAAIGYAFQSGVTSLLYVDLRIRREGFDVVLLHEHEQAGGRPTDALPGESLRSGGRVPYGPQNGLR